MRLSRLGSRGGLGLGGVLLSAVLLSLLPISDASAGAWVREKGEGLLISSVSIHQLFPAPGYEASDRLKGELSAYGEYGWSERLTLVGRAALQSMQDLALQTEETRFSVEVKPKPDPLRDDPRADYDGDGIPNLDDPPPPLPPVFERRTKTRTFLPAPEMGVGGIEIGARYQLVRTTRGVVSLQGMVGLPGSGENWNNLRFGEGGVSGDVRIMAGRSFGRSTFVNGSVGVRILPGGRPDEVRFDFTAGTHIARGVQRSWRKPIRFGRPAKELGVSRDIPAIEPSSRCSTQSIATGAPNWPRLRRSAAII
jgi:hypothetical protein